METFICFVDSYVVPILTVIFSIAAVYFYHPKDGSDSIWNTIVKVVALVLGIAVILICYLNFRNQLSEGAPTDSTAEWFTITESSAENTTSVSEESTAVNPASESEECTAVNPSQTEELPETAYAVIEASSTYDGDRASHIAYNLIDHRLQSNWTEGVLGHGEGEYVDFTFHTEQPVAGFIIAAGNHSSNMYYTKNSRPKTIMLTFSDGSTEEYTLLDAKKETTVYFDKVVNTNSIRLTIVSVYPGSEWKDTVISEFATLVQKPQT